jgi:hypothetical protein
LLLAANREGNTTWHLAALDDNVDVLQEICNLAKQNLTKEEIINKLLLATNRE